MSLTRVMMVGCLLMTATMVGVGPASAHPGIGPDVGPCTGEDIAVHINTTDLAGESCVECNACSNGPGDAAETRY